MEERYEEEFFASAWSDDGGVTCFYGMHGDEEDSMSPVVEWAAPINDLLYSPHYQFKSGLDTDSARN